MVWTAAVIALALQGAASPAGPYKLVISSESGVVVTDYPSRARCERAKLAVEVESARRRQAAEASLPQGSILTRVPYLIAACIPG